MIVARRSGPLAVVAACVLAGATDARAGGLSVTPSVAGAALARVDDGTAWYAALDLRLEALLGDPHRARVGGFVDGRILDDGEPALAAGLALAVPTSPGDGGTTLVLSGGVALRVRDGDPAGAGLARLSWGLRGRIDGKRRYELAVGLWTEARYVPDDGAVDVLIGVSADHYAPAFPVLYLSSAFR